MLENQKVAVVTGGSSGIGKATCLALAEAGNHVVVNYLGSKAAAEEVAAACTEFGVQAIAVYANVSIPEEVDALFDTVMEQFGRVDILVNNAGITKDNLLMRMSVEDFDAVIAINLRGAFLCMKKVAKIMMKQRYGRIVNVSSVVGVRGNAGQVNYAASKAGLIGMTKSMAQELAKRNVTVNAVAPGFIATKMTDILPEDVKEVLLAGIPMGRMGAVEDIADAIQFLGSDKASYITGSVLCVDGGVAM